MNGEAEMKESMIFSDKEHKHLQMPEDLRYGVEFSLLMGYKASEY